MSQKFSGPLLREAREAAAVPLERLALDIGRSAYSVQEYERGRVTPPTDVVTAMADRLGCSIELFFESHEDRIAAAVAAVVDNAPALTSDQVAMLRAAGLRGVPAAERREAA